MFKFFLFLVFSRAQWWHYAAKRQSIKKKRTIVKKKVGGFYLEELHFCRTRWWSPVAPTPWRETSIQWPGVRLFCVSLKSPWKQCVQRISPNIIWKRWGFFFNINLYICLKFLIPSDLFLMNYKYMLHFIIQLIFNTSSILQYTLPFFNLINIRPFI